MDRDKALELILGALNWLLADAIRQRPGDESERYYHDWLERMRKVISPTQSQ